MGHSLINEMGIETRLAQLNALEYRRDGELVGPPPAAWAAHARAVAIRIGLDRANELHVSAKALQ
jgi:hypothetical protein